MFSDPNQIVAENYFVDREQRLQIIGMTGSLRLLIVVFTEKEDSGVLKIHLISARKAESTEEEIYEEQISQN